MGVDGGWGGDAAFPSQDLGGLVLSEAWAVGVAIVHPAQLLSAPLLRVAPGLIIDACSLFLSHPKQQTRDPEVSQFLASKVLKMRTLE